MEIESHFRRDDDKRSLDSRFRGNDGGIETESHLRRDDNEGSLDSSRSLCLYLTTQEQAPASAGMTFFKKYPHPPLESSALRQILATFPIISDFVFL